ncbi:CD151 antigen [Solenopsis invicta]|uniref:CD151 antigen n=1 Tax=Solenopsis invicta TaxID=13686 RepID=UPI000596052D|nr:CD151 antigen [Solenopsis invicta]
MDSCGCIMKSFLVAINLVILIIGTILTIASVWGLIGQSSWIGEAGNNRLAAVLIVLVISGIIVMCISIFGIVIALRETKCMLLSYAIFAFLLLVIEIIGGVRQFNSHKEMIKLLEKEMEHSLQFYNDNIFTRNFWDMTQSAYQCCGVNSWEDWKTHGLKVPDSCCKSNQLSDCHADQHIKQIFQVYAEGCVNKLLSLMQHFTNITNGVSITVSCLLFLGMIFSLALYKKIK